MQIWMAVVIVELMKPVRTRNAFTNAHSHTDALLALPMWIARNDDDDDEEKHSTATARQTDKMHSNAHFDKSACEWVACNQCNRDILWCSLIGTSVSMPMLMLCYGCCDRASMNVLIHNFSHSLAHDTRYDSLTSAKHSSISSACRGPSLLSQHLAWENKFEKLKIAKINSGSSCNCNSCILQSPTSAAKGKTRWKMKRFRYS